MSSVRRNTTAVSNNIIYIIASLIIKNNAMASSQKGSKARDTKFICFAREKEATKHMLKAGDVPFLINDHKMIR